MVTSRSARALSADLDAEERLLQAMRQRAPKAQALREELVDFLDTYQGPLRVQLEGLLLFLAIKADSGHEVTGEEEGFVLARLREASNGA